MEGCIIVLEVMMLYRVSAVRTFDRTTRSFIARVPKAQMCSDSLVQSHLLVLRNCRSVETAQLPLTIFTRARVIERHLICIGDHKCKHF